MLEGLDRKGQKLLIRCYICKGEEEMVNHGLFIAQK